jgi:hypothetical protein
VLISKVEVQHKGQPCTHLLQCTSCLRSPVRCAAHFHSSLYLSTVNGDVANAWDMSLITAFCVSVSVSQRRALEGGIECQWNSSCFRDFVVISSLEKFDTMPSGILHLDHVHRPGHRRKHCCTAVWMSCVQRLCMIEMSQHIAISRPTFKAQSPAEMSMGIAKSGSW